jgi:hypothetical protein
VINGQAEAPLAFWAEPKKLTPTRRVRSGVSLVAPRRCSAPRHSSRFALACLVLWLRRWAQLRGALPQDRQVRGPGARPRDNKQDGAKQRRAKERRSRPLTW